MTNQHSVLDMARGYAVADSPSHINVLACEVVRLFEQEEATDKLLREIQRALWHAGFGRGQGRSELDGLFAALGAELGAYPAKEPDA